MKIIPNAPSNESNLRLTHFIQTIDKAACCFFILGMFLAAMLIHYLAALSV